MFGPYIYQVCICSQCLVLYLLCSGSLFGKYFCIFKIKCIDFLNRTKIFTMDASSLKISVITDTFSVISLLQVAVAYLLKNMNTDLEEHLQSTK